MYMYGRCILIDLGVFACLECLVIKSGSDFRFFSEIDIFMAKDGALDVRLIKHEITGKILREPTMEKIVQRYMDLLEQSLDTCIGSVMVRELRVMVNLQFVLERSLTQEVF